ncbi:hypothetical protein A7U60_g2325 [Sanghuangporus baumii]|uniref:Uncharacterized protein n=1 Tax=Sanghuangporus baumii TaxID=108892 RepID=A0A9Q5I3E3_SANBA|nr:hypothetical protein A7U60_g2325 [Sanghuangporus baumii]
MANALNRLKIHYERDYFDTGKALMPQPRLVGDAPHLRFDERLFEEEERASKMTFRAKSQKTGSAESLVSALHFCGNIAGGVKVFVMDYTDSETAQSLRNTNRPLPSTAYDDFERLLRQLDIVHGDLRLSNLEGNMLPTSTGVENMARCIILMH